MRKQARHKHGRRSVPAEPRLSYASSIVTATSMPARRWGRSHGGRHGRPSSLWPGRRQHTMV